MSRTRAFAAVVVAACVFLLITLSCGTGSNPVPANGNTTPPPSTPPSTPPPSTPPPSGGGQGSTIPAVVRWHYDLAGTGNNDRETILTPANVASAQFGKLFDITGLDGAVYAQPLYVPGLTVNGATHNVIFLATQHDMLYAYDADNPGPALWSRQLIDTTNGETYLDNPLVDTGKICCPDNAIGITGTPVIDQSTNTLYVVARTKKNNPRTYYQRLYAIDITTGANKAVQQIQATVPGNGDASFFPDSPNTLTFDRPYDQGGPNDQKDGIVETHQNQRGGLLLLGNQVYVTWGSHTDIHPYHGWIMAFDKTTLNLNVAFCATPNDQAGGIWMSGAAPSSDGTNIFLATGNGDYDPASLNYAQSLLRLNQNLTVADNFTPFNWATLNLTDLDLAASAPVVLPDQPGLHPHLLLMTGKEGTIYLVDRDNMGKFQQGSDSQIVQSIRQALPGIVRSAPAYWNGFVYYAGGIITSETPGATPDQFNTPDVLKAYQLQNGLLSTQPVMKGTQQFFFPGATPWVSSNGTTNGIVWVVRNPPPNGGAAILDAYDATNLSNLLFTSTPGSPNQTGGNFTRFVVPVVVNGKVYVASSNNADEANGRISVYGLKPQ